MKIPILKSFYIFKGITEKELKYFSYNFKTNLSKLYLLTKIHKRLLMYLEKL